MLGPLPRLRALAALMLDPRHAISSCSSTFTPLSIHVRPKGFYQEWFTDRCSSQVLVSINSLSPTLRLPKWYSEAITFYAVLATSVIRFIPTYTP